MLVRQNFWLTVPHGAYIEGRILFYWTQIKAPISFDFCSTYSRNVEGIIEKFEELKGDLDKERKFMNRVWAKARRTDSGRDRGHGRHVR